LFSIPAVDRPIETSVFSAPPLRAHTVIAPATTGAKNHVDQIVGQERRVQGPGR
jgi:hypothetical protein